MTISIRKIFTAKKHRKALAIILVLLMLSSSLRFLLFKPKEVLAADILIKFDEGYGSTSAVHDTNNTVSAGSITNAVWKNEDLCKEGKCLYFDGSGDYVSFSDNASLDMAASDNVTIEGWFRTPDISSGTRVLVAKHNGTAGGYKIYIDSNGYLTFGIDGDSTWTPSDTASTSNTSTSLDDNKWHFFAAVKNGTSSISLYVDGILHQTDSSITSSSLINADSLYIGIDGNGTSNGFLGFMDEVRILRSARTESEIKADYLGSSASTSGAGPVAYWKFNEAGDATRHDFSGNNNDLTESTADTIDQATGKYDYAADFERADTEYLEISDSNQTGLDLGNTFTLSAWLNVESTPDLYEGIIAKSASGAVSYALATFGPNNQLQLMIDDDGFAGGGIEITSGADIFRPGEWNHFAITYNGSVIRLYKNGVEQTTGNFPYYTTITPYNGNAAFRVGNWESQNGYYDGLIDELKVYNYARSQSQIVIDMFENPPPGASISFTSNTSWISNGLVGYWKLDESSGNASDSSGNSTTLTDTNTVSFVGGKFGNAGDFESTASEYQYAADNSALSITGSLTLAAWIKPESVTSGSYNIIAKWDGTNESYRLFQNGDEIRLELDSAGNYQETTASNLTASTWYHVVGVYDSTSQTAKIYINGVEASSSTTGTIPSSIGDDSGRFHIGAEDSTTTATNFYDGIIDEARVYNRALSPAEVARLYSWAPGPIAHYKLDENTGSTTYNSSGNGTTGTLYNGASYTQGKYGSAVKFDGTNDLIELGDDNNIDVDANGSITVSAWVYITKLTSDAEIVSKKLGYDASQVGWTLYQFSTANGGNICAYISSGVGQSSEACTADNSTNSSLNTWEHWAFTFDRSTRYTTLYRNGVKANYAAYDVTPASIGSVANTQCARIGAQSKSTPCDGSIGANPFSGLIDDVRIYNYVRTPAQIIEDMNAGHPAPGSPIGSAVAHWKFDEGYGTTANDSLTNDNDLTLSSSSWTNSAKFGKAWNGTGALWLFRTDDDDFDISATDDYSISLWFKSDSATNPSATEYLLNKASATTQGYAIYINTSGQICFGIDDDTTWDPDVSSCTTDDFYDANWHHITAVRNTTLDETRIYVDSTSRDFDSDTTTATLANSLSLYLGDRDGTDNGNEFNGDLDEVKIFRSALTGDQVKLLYSQSSAAVWGATSTDSSGNPTWSANNEYCPPGQGSTCTPPYLEYKFDENTGTTVYDTGTSGNNGTLYSTAGFRPGKFSSALYLDGNTTGNDSHVQLPDGALNSLTQGTISLWYKSNLDSSASDWQAFLTARDNAAGQFLELAYQISDNTVRWWGDACTTLLDASFTVTSPSGWHHIAVVVDSNGYKMYLDGVLKTSGTNTCFFDDVVGTGSEFYEIGCYDAGTAPSCTGELYRGYIDNFRIYDYPLTPSQIAWEYNRGRPQGWWKFDENTGTTAYDSSGNSYNSQTFTGNTTWTTGKFNTALTFDGTDDIVRITEGAGVDFGSTTDNYSVSAWFKTTTNYTTNPGTIVAKNDGTGVYPFDLQINTSEQPCVVMNDGTTRTLCGTATVNDGAWHLITAVRNISTDTVYLYIDGTLVNSQTDPTTASMSNNDDVSIGNSGAGTYTTNDFAGDIDDARIFNYSLNSTQIKLLYNEGSALRFGPSSGLP